jgi:hypothetical protein
MQRIKNLEEIIEQKMKIVDNLEKQSMPQMI